MSLAARIDQDLKTAMLAGDAPQVSTLRSLKSAILYVEVDQGKRDSGLDDADVQRILTREARKRQESADLYTQGGSPERAARELAEKAVIERYLPPQLSEGQLLALLDETLLERGEAAVSQQTMGAVIAAVRQRAGPGADGAVIARLVKERMAR